MSKQQMHKVSFRIATDKRGRNIYLGTCTCGEICSSGRIIWIKKWQDQHEQTANT